MGSRRTVQAGSTPSPSGRPRTRIEEKRSMKPTGSDVVCAALDLKQTHVDVSMQGVAFERVAAEGSDFASPVWNTIIGAAVQLQMSEPVLRPLLQKTILSRASPAEMLSAQLARQLADRDI